MPGMQGTGEGSGTWPLGRGWDIRLGLHTDRRAKAGKGPREGWLGSQSLDLRQQARQKGIPGEKNPGHVMGEWTTDLGCYTGRISIEGQTFPWPCHEVVGSGACAKYSSRGWRLKEVDGV